MEQAEQRLGDGSVIAPGETKKAAERFIQDGPANIEFADGGTTDGN